MQTYRLPRARLATFYQLAVAVTLFGIAGCASQSDESEPSMPIAEATSSREETVKPLETDVLVNFGQMCNNLNGCTILGWTGASATYRYGTRPILIDWKVDGHQVNERVIIDQKFHVQHMVEGWSNWFPLNDGYTVHDWDYVAGVSGWAYLSIRVGDGCNLIIATGPDAWSGWGPTGCH